MHLRNPLINLGCPWCDTGHVRLCDENPNTNPMHLYGAELFKCCVPDAVYEEERQGDT
jgi:hypothetical protein